jgi:hypothetical protein
VEYPIAIPIAAGNEWTASFLAEFHKYVTTARIMGTIGLRYTFSQRNIKQAHKMERMPSIRLTIKSYALGADLPSVVAKSKLGMKESMEATSIGKPKISSPYAIIVLIISVSILRVL